MEKLHSTNLWLSMVWGVSWQFRKTDGAYLHSILTIDNCELGTVNWIRREHTRINKWLAMGWNICMLFCYLLLIILIEFLCFFECEELFVIFIRYIEDFCCCTLRRRAGEWWSNKKWKPVRASHVNIGLFRATQAHERAHTHANTHRGRERDEASTATLAAKESESTHR